MGRCRSQQLPGSLKFDRVLIAFAGLNRSIRKRAGPHTKALRGNQVALTQNVESLRELAEIVTAFDIAPAVFNDNVKTNASLRATDWLIYDFDDGTPSAQVHALLCGGNYRNWKLNHLIAGSKSHLRVKGDGRGPIERFHVFIPLRTPITDADYGV